MKLDSEIFEQIGESPFSCIVCDFDFNNHPQDVIFLQNFLYICSYIHAPVITNANAYLLQIESWKDIKDLKDIRAIFESPEYIRWNSLRDEECSKYLALTLPRFLGRTPYGESNPTKRFDYQESIDNGRYDTFCWSSSAYLLAVNLAKSFKKNKLFARLSVNDLGTLEISLYKYKDENRISRAISLETKVSKKNEMILSKKGLVPVLQWKNAGRAMFLNTRILHNPMDYPDHTPSLEEMLCVSRFATYLKCIARDLRYRSVEELENELSNWLQKYVSVSGGDGKDNCKHPLSGAEISLSSDKNIRGRYDATIKIEPDYQFERKVGVITLNTEIFSA